MKLQEEIDDLMESKEDGEELNAEDITNMNYLDQVKSKVVIVFKFSRSLIVCSDELSVALPDFSCFVLLSKPVSAHV